MPRARVLATALVCRVIGLLHAVKSSATLSCFSAGFGVSSPRPAASLDKTKRSTGNAKRRLMMDASATPPAELQLFARFGGDESIRNRRLQTLVSEMAAKYGGRVAAQLEEDHHGKEGSQPPLNGDEPSLSDKGCLPAFRLMRAGLAMDEYRPHGNAAFEPELHKRVQAALSLCRSGDTATLKNIWSPAAAVGAYRDEMAVATYAVQVACNVARQLQGELCRKAAINKMDSSPVTVADFSVQAIVLGVLEQYFPDHDFIAEETSSVLREDPPSLEAVRDVVSKTLGRVLTEGELCAAIDLGAKGFGGKQQGRQRRRRGKTWVLDPIDGTKGFLRGEQFCVALGLLDEGKAVAGVLGCPNLPTEVAINGARTKTARGLLYTATVGEGSFVRALSSGVEETRRIEVDRALRASETQVLESVESGHSSHEVAARVSKDLGIDLPPIRVDGQCKYGLLSQGQGGIYLRLPRWGYMENIWDHVAGAVVIQEAGGKVTDSRGEPLDFSRGAKLSREVVGIVATNGKIHAEVVRAVHRRQVEDWGRVVTEAKRKAGEDVVAAPPLPGVEWASRNGRAKVDGDWWATARSQRQPLAMRTSEQFYGALERGWDKLVAVLFHGIWTPESEHAVSILERLAGRQHKNLQASSTTPNPRRRAFTAAPLAAGETLLQASTQVSEKGTGTVSRAPGEPISVVLAEADVKSLIDVADRQAIARLPSMHVYLGGREILRFPVHRDETAESLGEKIAEIASNVCGKE